MSSLFRWIGEALKKGTLGGGASKTEVDQSFVDANKNLEKYIDEYHITLKKW